MQDSLQDSGYGRYHFRHRIHLSCSEMKENVFVLLLGIIIDQIYNYLLYEMYFNINELAGIAD